SCAIDLLKKYGSRKVRIKVTRPGAVIPAKNNGTIEVRRHIATANHHEIHLSHQLCNAPQPDDPARRCIRYLDHTGSHQTFVSEWNEGDKESRRRPRPVSAAPKHESKRPPKRRPFRPGR